MPAHKEHRAVYPPEIVAAAQAAQRRWNVPASVTLAQWALESGFGRHMPPGSNNPFGIKARPGDPGVPAWTTEVYHGVSKRQQCTFRKFTTIGDAFERHAELLSCGPYLACKALLPGHPAAYVHAIAKPYATDPDYADKLLTLIAHDNLTQYDVIVPPAANG